MTPTEVLIHEHKIILLVLDAAEREAASIRTTGNIHTDTIRKMIDFFRTFADRCHHAKEENHLFRMMHERGFPMESGPLAVMLHEHDEGRIRVKEIDRLIPSAEQGDTGAVSSIARLLSEYAELLRSHIGKEDNVLYPMAENILSQEDMDALAGIFEKVEAEEIGTGVHETYHALAHEIAGK
jgi:hemerythrin-like domain-containing protein